MTPAAVRAPGQAFTAAALLVTLREAGASVRAEAGDLVVRAPANTLPASLVASLREHKGELLALLVGERCRRCGARMAWPGPAGVVYANGEAEHHACRLWAAARRAVESPDALADEAELTARGEPLP
jgi:hypothetical protein